MDRGKTWLTQAGRTVVHPNKGSEHRLASEGDSGNSLGTCYDGLQAQRRLEVVLTSGHDSAKCKTASEVVRSAAVVEAIASQSRL